MRRVVLLSLAAAAAVSGVWCAARAWRQAPDAAPNEAPSAPAPLPPAVTRRAVPAPARPVAAAREVEAASPFSALNEQALEALEQGELVRAIELWEQCLRGAPQEAVFRHNLAEALLRRALLEHERVRPCPDCIAWVERALELDGEREAITRLLERWRAESDTEQGFMRDVSVHFELSYDGWRDGLPGSSRDILDELERHYVDLAELFGIQPAERGRPLISVVLYRRAEFALITGLAEWAGASYDGTIRVPLSDGRGLDAPLSVLLRHELVHGFVRELGGAQVPAWLNEGVAQWFQRDAHGDLAAARATLGVRQALPLERLTRPFASLASSDERGLAYAESLLFCEFLERQYGRATLVRMVAGCRAGDGAGATFEAWIGIGLGVAFDDWVGQLSAR